MSLLGLQQTGVRFIGVSFVLLVFTTASSALSSGGGAAATAANSHLPATREPSLPAAPSTPRGLSSHSRLTRRRIVAAAGSRHVIRQAEVWTSEVVHELQGAVEIAAGGTLTIEAGARVEGRPGSSLTVERDGRLVADGTPLEPIELTCTSVPKYEGCWGGVTLLGNAPLNHGTPTSPAARGVGAAGCLEALGSGGTRYGGCEPADSAGVLHYVRVEYARDGLQLLGVGSGSVVDFVQVNRSRQNGLTINGGTADVRHLFLTANQRYGMAWYGGWIGRGQFVTIQQDADINRGGIRGSNAPSEGSTSLVSTPRSNPTLFNVTVVSPSSPSNPNAPVLPAAIVLAEGTAGTLRNVLLYAPAIGLDVQDELTCTPFDGTLPTLRNLLVVGATSVGSPDPDPFCDAYVSPNLEAQWIADPVNAASVVSDPAQVASLLFSTDLSLPDLRPSSASQFVNIPLESPPNDGFFLLNSPDFVGSTDLAASMRSNIPWYAGWTSPAPVPPVGGLVSGTVGGTPPRAAFPGVTVSSANGVSTLTTSGGAYSFALGAGTHVLTTSQLPGECAAAPVTAVVPSGGTATAPIVVQCTAVIRIAPGPDHVCAATQDGRTLCWGRNDVGSLGNGSTSPPVSTPGAAAASFPLTSISTGYNHTCAIGPLGVAYCWGLNALGALGNGGVGGVSLTPTPPVDPGVGFVAIAAGGYHTCALTAIGDTWCWGWNQEGQTGIGMAGTPVLVPTRIADGAVPLVSLTAGDSHTCGLTAAGAAYCWGGNGRGELGADPAVIGAMKVAPFPVPGGHVFTSIAAGRTHTCGITTTGQALCWGDRAYGQTGDGVIGGMTLGPTPVGGGFAFSSVTAGSETTCALTFSGAAYCWGRGDGGLLGNGSTTSAVASPGPVSGSLTLMRLSLSMGSGAGGVACSVDALGLGWCWGAGGLGQRGDGSFTALVTQPVAVRLPPPF